MIGDIFLKLLNRSITASWLILAVLLLRLLLKKMPKWIHCLLWAFVAVRLVCPFSIESVYSLIPSAETVQTENVRIETVQADGTVTGGQNYTSVPRIDSDISVINNVVNPILRETFAGKKEESADPIQVYAYVAGIIWCCGVLAMLAYALMGRFQIRRMVKEAVCYKDNIYLCDAVESPFIFGIAKPRIYLPSGMETGMQEYDYVAAHELAHLKRKDHWWKPLGYLLLAVYWFHPLCWAAYILLCRDIEFACDEKVIRDMSLGEKKEYSKALLSCSMPKRKVLICPLAFGEIRVKERIKSVLAYKKAPVLFLVAAVAVCVVVAVCFLTNPPRKYEIRVTIPAGSTERFAFSEEEICPKGGTVTLYAGEGLGDSEIVLLPTEVAEGKFSFQPTYITPGMPVKYEVEKGAWYKIGVNVQKNSGEEDLNVYVVAENVEVRIADMAEAGLGWSGSAGLESGNREGNGLALGNGNMGREGDESGQGNGGIGQEGNSTGQGSGNAGQEGSGSGQGNGSADQEGSGSSHGDGSVNQEGNSSGQTGGTPGEGNGNLPDGMSAVERYDVGDLDGNGETEYVLVYEVSEPADYDGHLSFYFNGESIYEYDDLLRVVYVKDVEYIDLDSDGVPEIFFSFCPMVNSMPLIEYAVLKRTDNGWKALEMIHGETMLDNGFPISSRYGKEEETIVISCEGLEKQIVYHYRPFFEKMVKEYEEDGIDSPYYKDVLNHYVRGDWFQEGDEFGGIAAWGVHEIKSGTYEGENCLIATHGLEGPNGKFEFMGNVDIYFNYDKDGLVKIVNMEFREGYSD